MNRLNAENSFHVKNVMFITALTKEKLKSFCFQEKQEYNIII